MPQNQVKRLVIVIPAFNESRIIQGVVKRVQDWLDASCPMPWLLVLACSDRSTDKTCEIASGIARDSDHVESLIINEPPGRGGGRGLALKASWRKFPGSLHAFMDADLAVPLDQLLPLIDAVRSGSCDAAIGTRYLDGSSVHRERGRVVASRAYNFMLQSLFGSKATDHQCGFRVFSRTFVEQVVLPCKADSWFLDTECVIKGQEKGFTIREFPVTWTEKRRARTSLVRLLHDIKKHGAGMISLALDAKNLATFREMAIFSMIGALGFACVLLVTSIAAMFTTSNTVILIVNALIFAAMMVVQFFLNRRFTFKSRDKTKARLIIDLIVRSVGLLVNSIIVSLLMYHGVSFAAMVGVIGSMFTNFTLNKLVVFRSW